MSLITCPECNAAISDRAGACPHCGCPNDTLAPIELTSKKLKAQQAIAAVLSVCGIGFAFVGFVSENTAAGLIGGFLLAGGVSWLIAINIAIWWKHK